MKEIIDWLLEMEQLAGKCYREAADKYPEDKELADFLSRMAECNRW